MKKKKTEGMLFRVFDTLIQGKIKGFLLIYLRFVGNFLTLFVGHLALLNFQIFHLLDFPQLLDALGKRLKFHINEQEDSKNS